MIAGNAHGETAVREDDIRKQFAFIQEGIDSVIIISQKWHNERSIYLADKMGIHAIGYNAKDARNTRTFLTHIREKLARVKIFIDIYITNRKDFNL
jgi:SanA protein